MGDNECDFQIPDGSKIIAFAGIFEVLSNDCRFLNLSVISKQIQEDCKFAENSLTYKETIQSPYTVFNVIKTDFGDQIKRIKAVYLYHGFALNAKGEQTQTEVVGGIKIIYELKNGEEIENGITKLACTDLEREPEFLELKDFEFIVQIFGTGSDYIKSLTITTNSYKRIKVGQKTGKLKKDSSQAYMLSDDSVDFGDKQDSLNVSSIGKQKIKF